MTPLNSLPIPAYDKWGVGVETLYGSRKRLHFLIREIEAFRTAAGIERNRLRLLDVGCGTGLMITLPLASLGYRVLGLDIDRSSIETAAGLNKYDNAEFRCADLFTLDADDGFDVIICSEVLEHVADPAAFLDVMARAAKKRNLFLLTVPNGFGPFEAEKKLWEKIEKRVPPERITKLNESLIQRAIRRNAVIQSRRVRMGLPLNSKFMDYFWNPRYSGTSTCLLDDRHVNFFSMKSLRRLLEGKRIVIKKIRKSVLLAGPLSNTFLRFYPNVIWLNAIAADIIPARCASGWFLAGEFAEKK